MLGMLAGERPRSGADSRKAIRKKLRGKLGDIVRSLLPALASVLLSTSVAAAALERFTPAEAAQVDNLAQNVEQQCKTQAIAELKQKAAESNDPPTLMDKLTSGDYCGCIGRNIRARATPALVRRGTEADGQKMVQQSASDCAAQNFKAGFPAICHSWATALPDRANLSVANPEKMDQACACVQKRVDQITGDTLAETTRQTIGDYERYRRNPEEPQQWSPMSVMGSYMTCFKEAGLVRQGAEQPNSAGQPTAASPHAAAESAGDAAQLIQVMQMDRTTLLGFQASMRDGLKQGKVTQRRYDCLLRADPSAFTDIYVRGVPTVMTNEEIRTAVQFYRSSAGTKSILAGLAQLNQKIGTPAPDAVLELTPADNQAVEVFSKTSAGKKLIFDNVLQSPPITDELKRKIVELVSACPS